MKPSLPSPDAASSAVGIARRPAGADPAPVVLILPPIAGLDPYIAGVADELARAGYASLCVDYYARTGRPDLSSRAHIMAAVASLSDRQVLADIETGIGELAALPGVDASRLSVLGFCVGGSYAMLAAAAMNAFSCAIAFYGGLTYPAPSAAKPLAPLDAAEGIRCPFLGHYGEADALIPLDEVEQLRQRLKSRAAEIYTYPGAGHAFHENFRPQVYRPVAAETAWRRSMTYLAWYAGRA